MYLAVKKPEYLIYGKDSVMDAVKKGIAKVVIVSEDVGEDEIMNLTLTLKGRRDIELFVMPKSVEENLTLTQTFGGYVAILSTPSWILEASNEDQDRNNS